jgi:predicted SnoaL-like aldol condensation-catalyzing enzyme
MIRQMTSKKEIVRDLLMTIETGNLAPLAHVRRYVQHNLSIEDGVEGLTRLVRAVPPGSARVRIVRMFEDHDHVVAHTEYELFGPAVGFDVFRLEGDRIVEHWDNLTERARKPNPSGRTQLDGPTQVVDLDLTSVNKRLVGAFVRTVLLEQQFIKAPAFVDGYIQHNTHIGDGLPAFAVALQQSGMNGSAIVYHRMHKVLGEGNFVLTVSEGTLGRTPTAFYDLFRVAGGKIVEHWDVLETIPARESWANPNGKF